MAHILFIYKQFPGPDVGHAGGVALFRLMQEMHRRGHRLTLVARILETEKPQVPALQALCEAVHPVPHHRDLPGPRPLAVIRSYLTLRRMAKHIVRSTTPDFVHVETTQTALILAGMRLPNASFRTQDINWFLQAQRAQHLRGFSALGAHALQMLFRWLEPALWRRYNVLLTISEGDRRLMAPHTGDKPLLLVPLSPMLSLTAPDKAAAAESPALLFVGAMGRNHNVDAVTWFMAHIWPRVHTAVPQARFYIVGGNPPDTIRAAADGTSVIVTGYVKDLAPWYHAADVFVAPLLVAGGLLQKVVDAMATGVPVVATSVCNHGLCATPGEHLLIADTPEAFIEAVLRLLQNADERSRLGAAGKQFIEQHYDLDTALNQWEHILLNLESPALSGQIDSNKNKSSRS